MWRRARRRSPSTSPVDGRAVCYGIEVGTVEGLAGHFYVYLYRSASGVPKYVGYGMSVERALAHAGASHNAALRAWLDEERFDLSVAGPYRDEAEGKAVEAALISALRPEFNRAPGDGPKFVPIGVPPELSDRPAEPPLSLERLGEMTGGALLVYLAPGDVLPDGRTKYDPARPSDSVVVANMEGVWDLSRHLDDWRRAPNDSPRVLVGVHGKRVSHRFIVGATEIQVDRWGASDLEVPHSRRWRVPLVDRSWLDAFALRGRRVDGVRFGQFSWQLHIWVDATGKQRHPPL